MYEFCYDYVKPKYCEKANFCFIDADSFIVYIKNMIFIKILFCIDIVKTLKLDLILQIRN